MHVWAHVHSRSLPQVEALLILYSPLFDTHGRKGEELFFSPVTDTTQRNYRIKYFVITMGPVNVRKVFWKTQ
jgi:hypothetical protein